MSAIDSFGAEVCAPSRLLQSERRYKKRSAVVNEAYNPGSKSVEQTDGSSLLGEGDEARHGGSRTSLALVDLCIARQVVSIEINRLFLLSTRGHPRRLEAEKNEPWREECRRVGRGRRRQHPV
jgi:hypothetical protein